MEKSTTNLGDSNSTLVVFTADQDWAPEWAMQIFVSEFEELQVPIHLFRTNHSAVFDSLSQSQLFSDGWHPNFRENSSHGNSIDEVISTMKEMFPGRTSVRCHSFFESTEIWLKLVGAGMKVESHGLTDLQDGLSIQNMASGMNRIPVYFEDDVYIPQDNTNLMNERLLAGLRRPGLKVLSFHPIHIAMNTPNIPYYTAQRTDAYDDVMTVQEKSYGVRDLLADVVKFCFKNNLPVISFSSLSSVENG